MKWKLVWTRPALRDMKKLDATLARRIRDSLTRLAETGHGDVVRLKDVTPPEWRPRIGDRRTFFQFDDDSREIHSPARAPTRPGVLMVLART